MRFSTHQKALACALFAALALVAALALQTRGASAKPPLPKALQVEAISDVSLDAGVPQSSTTATIVFMTVPYVTSKVTWGKKLLGKILPGKPLVVVRPRDSGPLDVMVRAAGYLPVQTRAHTFSDSRVMVKLTPLDKKTELLGYRVPLEAGLPEGGLPEGGLPEGGLPFDGGLLYAPPAAPPMPVQTPAPGPPSMY